MEHKKGIFAGVARHVEWRKEGEFTVVSFKLGQVDEDGNISEFVPVTVREKKILGSLNDGDEIEIGGKIKADGFLKPKIIYNENTQAYMKQPRLPLVVIPAFLLSCIFLSIHIVLSALLPECIPVVVVGGNATVVTQTACAPAWLQQIYEISLYLALSLFFIAGIISIIRITCTPTTYWLSKLKTRIPAEVRLTLIFSVIVLIGLLILLFNDNVILIVAFVFVLLFIIAYSLICGIGISKARRRMKL